MPPSPGSGPTRRSVIGGLIGGAMAGLGTLSGCDLGAPEAEPDARPEPGSSTPPADPDTELVSAVRTELMALSALVSVARSGRPRLADDLADLADLHLAHLAALPEGEEPVEPPAVYGPPGRVRAEVVRREVRGQQRLADWSIAAESGALARLLASMSAGVAAHLAALPTAGGQA